VTADSEERDVRTPRTRVSAAPARVLARGYVVAAVPLILLFLPLLAHRSVVPAFLTFSDSYARFLAICIVVVLGVPLLVAAACRWSGSLSPAHAFVLALVGIVLGCLAVETILTHRLSREDAFSEYRAWGHERSLLFAFEATPHHRWENAGATYTTDGFGFRTHLRGPWGTSRGTRIFALGESSVFGYGLNDDQTWPHLLEEKLRTRLGDPALNVVNAGNNGHTSLQTLFRFYARVLPEAPTHVILYLGPNDLYGTGKDRLLISEDVLFSGSVAQFWAAETRAQNLYARSLLFYVIQQHVPALAQVTGQQPTDTSAVAAAQVPPGYETPDQELQRLMTTIGGGYVENIGTICLIAEAKGIKPVLLTFMHDMTGRPQQLLENNNALLRRFASEKGFALIDVAAAFAPVPEKASYFFADHYHPNPSGAAFIASVVAERWP
jgi:lysophospholipase L1-like esterase